MTRFFKRLAIAAILVLPAAADASVWKINGVFSDGTALAGRFSFNVYGFLDTAHLTTKAQGVFTGATYAVPSDSASNTAFGLDVNQHDYTADLHLGFVSDITTATGSVALLTSSYECRGSGNCYNASGGDVRYLVSGVATVPETATWVMLVAGLGFAGVALRYRRLTRA
ncbi:hypothetical protein KZX46_08065 [Polymorphobacter sp. PAMC 29334]|uniref:PEP-CTERM sorting domain-containing protein n=1 Tax=Polymorphobacter sp. PAMC 29334 TaxID=2862331 RepID=UPI001C753CD2|nr:PEP-CTERM sorting domain-containing protein [Polymorphobacter sp. PAMC 29334]QYE35890.1 hypothetical protein KZX46_08065 [Polymorphobacter sp. PAMC 29334]